MSRPLRGAIIGIDPGNPVASTTVFQYNPDQIVRTLTPKFSPGGPGAAKSEALKLSGPPDEKITFDLEIDATDQLAAGGAAAKRHGIHPQLAALEMLLYPKAARVIVNAIAAAVTGTIEIIPPEAPLAFFTWGLKRVVPVKVITLTITETAFDAALNPIKAKVAVQLHVLNYDELPPRNAGYAVFLAHQIAKEALAVSGTLGAVGELSGGSTSIF